MFSALVKTLLILTSLTPICLVYAWVCINEGYIWAAFWLLVGSSFFVIACYFILMVAARNLEVFSFEFRSVEPVDQENVSYMLLYISPLFLDKVSDVNMNVIIPALLLYALLLATSYTYHFNPLVGLMGWHFYKVEANEGVSYILLTKKKIRNVDRIEKVGLLIPQPDEIDSRVSVFGQIMIQHGGRRFRHGNSTEYPSGLQG